MVQLECGDAKTGSLMCIMPSSGLTARTVKVFSSQSLFDPEGHRVDLEIWPS